MGGCKCVRNSIDLGGDGLGWGAPTKIHVRSIICMRHSRVEVATAHVRVLLLSNIYSKPTRKQRNNSKTKVFFFPFCLFSMYFLMQTGMPGLLCLIELIEFEAFMLRNI